MPELQNRFEFEPDAGARKAWLATRKKPVIYSLPGFYNTIDYEKDSGWFMIALCIETAAVVLTLYGGYKKGLPYLIAAIIVVFLFVLFDLVGANLFHKKAADKCEINNRIILEKDPGVKEGLRNDLRKGILYKVSGILLIALSAIFKIMAILLLGRLNLNFYVIMSLLYLIVVYIHLAHTGYYLAERNTIRMFRKQHEQWSDDKRKAAEGRIEVGNIRWTAREPSPKSRFDSEIKIKLENDKVKVGEHSISFIEEKDLGDKKVYIYEIETKGLLTDQDIVLFTGNAETDQQGNTIALACLKHQVSKTF